VLLLLCLLVPGRLVARLVRAHRDLGVAAAVHGALVDVRRAHDDVLVIHCMQTTTGQTETIMIILVCFVILD